MRHDCVTDLMVCGGLQVFCGDNAAALFGTVEYALDSFVDIRNTDGIMPVADGKNSGLVKDVLKVSARTARGELSYLVKIHIRLKGLLPRVYLKDLLPALDVGIVDRYLAVKPAGTQQRGVENIGAVGRRNDDNALAVGETVHFDEQLIEGLLTLIVSAAEACAAGSADCVDLINKYDCRSASLCRLEQVTNTAGADAYIQLQELRSADGEERNMSFSGDSLGKQGLTGAGRAYEQNALGDPCAHVGKCLGRAQEVDDLSKLLFFLICSGNISKGHGISQLICGAGVTLCEACSLLFLALVNEYDYENHSAQNDDIGEQNEKDGSGGGRIQPAAEAVVKHRDTVFWYAVMRGQEACHLTHENIGRTDSNIEVVGLALLKRFDLVFGNALGIQTKERFLSDLNRIDDSVFVADLFAKTLFDLFKENGVFKPVGIAVHFAVAGGDKCHYHANDDYIEQNAPYTELVYFFVCVVIAIQRSLLFLKKIGFSHALDTECDPVVTFHRIIITQLSICRNEFF